MAIELANRKRPNLKIPDVLNNCIPIHWKQFLDEANNELSTVTSKIYDGGVSKGTKHG